MNPDPNQPLEQRVRHLESQNKIFVGLIQALLNGGEASQNFRTKTLENWLVLYKWQKDVARLLSDCESLDESTRQAFVKWADEASLNYERLELRIAELKYSPLGPQKPPGETSS